MSLGKLEVDINCDLGEIDPSLALERKIMPLIGRCNIAAGGHAGTAETMRESIFLALNHGVQIGAHPSYPDKDNFGRKRLDISDKDLMNAIEHQLSDFLDEVENCGATIDHIKAHGALYHYLNENKNAAAKYLSLVQEIIPEVKLLVPEHSQIIELIDEFPMEVIYEAFADRRYTSDKKLQSRSIEGSVISDPQEVILQIDSIIDKGGVFVDDQFIMLKANSICVHSDTENSVSIIEAINDHWK